MTNFSYTKASLKFRLAYGVWLSWYLSCFKFWRKLHKYANNKVKVKVNVEIDFQEVEFLSSSFSSFFWAISAKSWKENTDLKMLHFLFSSWSRLISHWILRFLHFFCGWLFLLHFMNVSGDGYYGQLKCYSNVCFDLIWLGCLFGYFRLENSNTFLDSRNMKHLRNEI